MRVQIRKTLSGIEYWDTDEKRTVFVPHGMQPDFEVTIEPKSLIGKAATELVLDEVHQFESDEIEIEDDNYSMIKSEHVVIDDDIDKMLADEDEIDSVDISAMKIKELKAYAVEKKIEIPKEVTRRDDILEFISDYEMEKDLVEE